MEALEDAQLALRMATELGDQRHIYAALGNVGSCLYEQGRYRGGAGLRPAVVRAGRSRPAT